MTFVRRLALGALLLVVGCGTTMSRIPETSVKPVGGDVTLEARAGAAAPILSEKRFRDLEEKVEHSEKVLELTKETTLFDGRLGPLPPGSRLGFAYHGNLEWCVLGGEANVLGWKLPAKSFVSFEIDAYAHHEVVKRIVLGDAVEYGGVAFAAGVDITQWFEGTRVPAAVVVGSPRSYDGRSLAAGDQVFFSASGKVKSVETAEERDRKARAADAAFEERHRARIAACELQCSGQSGILKRDCLNRCER